MPDLKPQVEEPSVPDKLEYAGCLGPVPIDGIDKLCNLGLSVSIRLLTRQMSGLKA